MYRNKKIFVIIGAAGSGRRMAAPLPKQYLKIGNLTILEKTVDKFIDTEFADKIVLVVSSEYENFCRNLFSHQGNIEVVCGGLQRQDSIYEGLCALKKDAPADDDLVLIHDGARPFVSKQVIVDVIEGTLKNGAAIAAIPATDTIRHITEGTMDRSKLYHVQTPQGFAYSIIKQSYEKAFQDGFYGTDDASLVERIGKKVSIAKGEKKNIKITTMEDLKTETRVGTGFDVHVLTENRKLILGGVEIPFDRGLLGHSDADVLTHSLMDAILGAAALGDIGKLFPDSDEEFAGISSLVLLKRVMDRIAREGYALGNADMTIVCQKPKLAPYIEEMRENLAKVLKTDVEKISIKATTTEKLGFEGREEGISAQAVCILTRY